MGLVGWLQGIFFYSVCSVLGFVNKFVPFLPVLPTLPLLDDVKKKVEGRRTVRWFGIDKVKPFDPVAPPGFTCFEYTRIENVACVEDASVSGSSPWTEAEQQALNILVSDDTYNSQIFFYCLDIAERNFVFVKVSLSKQEILDDAFIYISLHNAATHLISIPMELLDTIRSKMINHNNFQRQTAMFFSTGRCGSTLAGKAISLLPHVFVLQEPSFTRDFVLLYPTGEDGDLWDHQTTQIDELFVLSHWVGFMSVTGKHWESSYVVFKFASQVCGVMNQYQTLLPDSRFLFMHRDAVKTASSFYRLMINFVKFMPLMDYLPLYGKRLARNADEIVSRTNLTYTYDIEYNAYVAATLTWFDSMLHAFHFIKQHGEESLPSFRMEEFTKAPAEYANIIRNWASDALDIEIPPLNDVNPDLKAVMRKNSQVGTFVSSTTNKAVVDHEKMSLLVNRCVVAFPEINEHLSRSGRLPGDVELTGVGE